MDKKTRGILGKPKADRFTWEPGDVEVSPPPAKGEKESK